MNDNNSIWVMNVKTNDINEIATLNISFCLNWKEAYSEMIERGYEFKIGKPRGEYNQYRGLYITNPLNIKIEKSEHSFVNKINERIKELQDNLVYDLFEIFEEEYQYANSIPSIVAAFAPPEACDAIIGRQEKAYKEFLGNLKNCSNGVKKSILKRVIDSEILNDKIKCDIIYDLKDLFNVSIKEEEIDNYKKLIEIFENFESEYYRCASTNYLAIAIAPGKAIEAALECQNEKYKLFMELLKISSPEVIKNMIKRVYESNYLNNDIRLSIIKEAITYLDEYKNINKQYNK